MTDIKNQLGGYFFVHFTGENTRDGEQVYFSLSKDGLHWEDLNNGQLVLRSESGQKGVRDPFIVRSPKENKFYIIATDLRIASGMTWQEAVTIGSKDIIVWESRDLIHWSEPWSVTVGIPSAGCVWAPEAIYDEQEDNFFVFWASNTKDDNGEAKHKIYSARTKNFRNFTPAEKYIELENHVIDTTMIYDDGFYYRFSKDETIKNIRVERGTSLEAHSFTVIDIPAFKDLKGVEGPEIFKFNDRDEWCLIVDRYEQKAGYLPLITSNLPNGDFEILTDDRFDFGGTRKRHGGVINITEEEYKRLRDFYHLLLINH
ncbi:MAG: glycosyl hydrolase family 43 [Anaerocolumna sp.]|jgi:sucrose-6-phosphate hydrolase SacC (GH32 family)|nr:glycosyl hydrolase family 43 [Anaerocolumna sp.]